MNSVFSPFVKSLLVGLLAVSATAVSAEEKKPAHAEAAAPKIDAAKGGTLYTDGDAARGLPACVSCHGAGGNSTIAVNPKLAGQHEGYLYKQLVNFTTADRNQPVMTTYAKMLSDEEKHNVAAWLVTQAPKPGAAKNKDTIVDFGPKYDSIFLDDAAFGNRTIAKYLKGKGAGLDHAYKMKSSFFRVGDKALDRDDFFIAKKVKPTEVKLYWDADGSDSKAMLEIGTVKLQKGEGTALTYKDFLFI